MEYAELIRVKDRAWNDLSKLPGVHAVGVGMKTVAGVRSDEPCIVVFVNEKKDRASLKQDDVVPARIEDAVTDVVEVQAPRLMRGTPVLDAVFTPSPTIGGGGTISFTTTTPPADNIPAGYMVVLCSSVTPAGKPTQRSAFQWPTGNQTLALFISNALSLTVPSGFSLSNPANTSIITVRPDPNTTILVDCYVLQLDRLPYRLEFLRGGIGIYGTEPGTLGCLATTAPTVKQPQGGVVGITCRHVVTTQKYLTSRVFGAVSSNFTTISVGQTPPASNPIPANSLLFIGFYKGNNLIASSFYQTATGDKPADIAKGIVDAITSASIGGVTAKQGLDPTVVEITGGNVGGTEVECIAIGPPREDPKAHLKIDVQEMNKTPGSLTTLLSFSGTISKKYRYGVTVSVNRNDFIPTFSIFVDLFGKTIDEAVAAISSAIMKVDASLRGPVTTLPPSGGTTITIRNAQSVECFISRDTRVGQPEDNFSWPCSHEIGHVGDMGRSVDAALIPLDAGTKYKTVIEGIGVVDGLVGPGLFKQGLQVQKRGSSSGLTTGVVQIFATTGISGKYTYRNAFVVESTSLNPQQGTVKPFIVGGDSGSVVVTAGPGPVQVVGLLFASFAATSALAIPMQQVVDSFPDAKLSFALAPGQAPDAIQTVPPAAVAFSGGEPRSTTSGGRRISEGFAEAGVTGRWREVENSIWSTSVGRAYANAFLKHLTEARSLVNSNRRIAAVWHRSGGAEIMNTLLDVLSSSDRCVPTAINGRPFAECLMKIQRVLVRYASPAFSQDINRYAPQMARCSGLTYVEMLSMFDDPEME